MLLRSVLLTAGVLLFTCCVDHRSLAADSQTSDEVRKSLANSLASDKAVVKDIVYGLEAVDGRLYLTSQALGKADTEVKRMELDFTASEDTSIDELTLAPLGIKNLMAVVKQRHGDELEFHCLTFIAPSGGLVRDKFAFHKAKFFTTQKDLSILAVGGKEFYGSVFIVLGTMTPAEKDPFVNVTEGLFYFSGCPWPPSDGVLSHFRVESVPPKDFRTKE